MCTVGGSCISVDTSNLCDCGVHVFTLGSRETMEPHRNSVSEQLLELRAVCMHNFISGH